MACSSGRMQDSNENSGIVLVPESPPPVPDEMACNAAPPVPLQPLVLPPSACQQWLKAWARDFTQRNGRRPRRIDYDADSEASRHFAQLKASMQCTRRSISRAKSAEECNCAGSSATEVATAGHKRKRAHEQQRQTQQEEAVAKTGAEPRNSTDFDTQTERSSDATVDTDVPFHLRLARRLAVKRQREATERAAREADDRARQCERRFSRLVEADAKHGGQMLAQGAGKGGADHGCGNGAEAAELRRLQRAFVIGAKLKEGARPHQLDSVAAVVRTLTQRGSAGPRSFLIAHSAGSGKSLTISLLAYRLRQLRLPSRNALEGCFRLIVVLTDRRCLDEQLGTTVVRFARRNGVDCSEASGSIRQIKGAQELEDALLNAVRRNISSGAQSILNPTGAPVLITTMQKFASVFERLRSAAAHRLARMRAQTGVLERKQPSAGATKSGTEMLQSLRVAVIADEAHRSHGQSTSASIRAVLGGDSTLLVGDSGSIGADSEGCGGACSSAARHRISLTYFGFTATPSSRTMQLFGNSSKGPSNMPSHGPFHTYSMARAVAEGHILDMRLNFEEARLDAAGIISSQACDTNVVRRKSIQATPLLLLQRKSAFVVQRIQRVLLAYREQQTRKTARQNVVFSPKAMLVARSRVDVVTYHALLRKCDPSLRLHASFSGTVDARVSGGATSAPQLVAVSEATLNGTSTQLELLQSRAEAHLIITCNKLETGYDDPALCILFIDRALRSASHTVQTLGRINRVAPGKVTTCGMFGCIDFVNSRARIMEAVARYWDGTDSRPLTAGNDNVSDSASAADSDIVNDCEEGND